MLFFNLDVVAFLTGSFVSAAPVDSKLDTIIPREILPSTLQLSI
jgi:hypothetical protein